MSFPIGFLIKGVILGFSIAAPVGPIGILCIRRTLQFGRWSGLCSGLGAAFADVTYASIAAFGLTFITSFLVAGQFWLRFLGGCFLFYFAIATFFAKVIEQSAEMAHTNLANDFFSTFLLTVTNPMTILSFLAVFAGLGLSETNKSYTEASVLVFGVLIGSAFWWFILSEGVTLFRKKVDASLMRAINRASGLIILCFALTALVATIKAV